MQSVKSLIHELGGENGTNFAAVIAALGAQAQEAEIIRVDGGVPLLVTSAGKSLTPVEQYLLKPLHIKESITTRGIAGFIEYVNKYKNADSLMTVLRHEAKVVVDIDYHGPNSPENCAHVITLDLEHTPEWTAWNKQHSFTQVGFAEFIEDNLPDFLSPDGATMLEIATKLKIDQKVEFQSGMTLQNGDTKFVYSVDTITRDMTVPAIISVAIPVFRDGSLVRCEFRMRFRLSEGKVTFVLKPNRLDKVHDEALDKVLVDVVSQCGLLTMIA